MSNKVDLDRAALILVESTLFGNERAAKRWGITQRTIANYKTRLNTDSDFSQLYNNKLQEYKASWMEDLPLAIRAGIDYLIETIPSLGSSPEEIHATVGAIKILAEIGITKELLDAKLNQYRQDREEDRLAAKSTQEENSQPLILDSKS